MILQINNKPVRSIQKDISDISFLNDFYEKEGHFPLFQQVLIETRTDCNNNCPFCPHHFVSKKIGVMEWDCYCRIIDNLCSIGYNGRIALMISNEPLLEGRLAEMIKYAKGKSQRFFLDITTNGRLLTLEKVDYLFSLGLDNINVNDYRGDRDLRPDGWTPNLVPIVKAYSNNAKISFRKRRLDEKWPNYAGIIPQQFDSSDFGFCSFPLRKLNISYSGDVILCCNDFLYETSFGNVMSRDLVDCWNDKAYDHYRLSLLDNKRIGLCSKCNDFQDYNAF